MESESPLGASAPLTDHSQKTSARRRLLLRTCVVLAAVLVVAVIIYQSATFISQPQQRRGRFLDGGNQPVGVTRIRRGDIRISLHALGAVTPLTTVTVNSQINGQLMSVGFKEGQLVRKGQFLAQIDPRPYQVALEQDQAQLARDDATLKQAQMDLVRYKTLSDQVSIGNRIWSLGATATDTMYDFGNRSAEVGAARATYDQYVASYRQTVLSGFQQVEDELLALRVLQQEGGFQSQAVKSAQTAANVALNEFAAGSVAYSTVITANQTLLADRQSALAIQQNRLVASVTLIEALGGGWDGAELRGP